MSFLDQYNPKSKSYDPEEVRKSKPDLYVSQASAHEFTAEVVSASIRQSTKPATKGQEFFIATLRVTDVTKGAYVEKGAREEHPLEAGDEVTVYLPMFASNPFRAKHSFHDACMLVSAAQGERINVYLEDSSKLRKALEDDAKKLQGKKMVCRCDEPSTKDGVDYFNTKFYVA